MSEMVKDHRKDVAEFKKQAGTSKDPQLKASVPQKLPTLQNTCAWPRSSRAR